MTKKNEKFWNGSANFTANFGQDTSSLTLNGNNEVSATYNTFGDLLTVQFHHVMVA